MRRILQLTSLLGACALSINAAAQAPAATPATAQAPATPATVQAPATPAPGSQGLAPAATGTDATGTGTAAASVTTAPVATPETTAPAVELPAPPPPPPEPELKLTEGWQTEFTGYFRTPMILGLSSRLDPPNTGGEKSAQVVFGPNRLVDAGYYSFGFTRLNEGDWAEIYLTEKRKHVAATVAFMGWWYQDAGNGQPFANQMPAQGFITLDSDVDLGAIKPHVELKMGIFWKKYGNIDKYDTYLFGRTHIMGEYLSIDLPAGSDLNFQIVDGFGTARDGFFKTNIVSVPVDTNNDGTTDVNGLAQTGDNLSNFSSATGLTLVHYLHLGANYKKMLSVGLNYNDSWTKDPTLFTGSDAASVAKGSLGDYAKAKEADMTLLGADVDVTLPVAGHLWLAFSYIDITNGWALAQGVEVMHSPGGQGIAKNYMGSNGSGSMLNFAFLYENSLSVLQGKSRGAILPDVTFNLFGMMASASRDLEATDSIEKKLLQFKWGADAKVDFLSWLAFMLRYDWVNVDMDQSGCVFGVLTPRVILSSHFLSNETIYLQYSRYFYGDKMTLASGTYAGSVPDANVIKMQATIGW